MHPVARPLLMMLAVAIGATACTAGENPTTGEQVTSAYTIAYTNGEERRLVGPREVCVRLPGVTSNGPKFQALAAYEVNFEGSQAELDRLEACLAGLREVRVTESVTGRVISEAP
jgi:hypothetical protein